MCVLMYALPARKGFIPLLAIASFLSRILLGISTHCKPYKLHVWVWGCVGECPKKSAS